MANNSSKIKVRGANVHNLKNINIDIPKNKLVVITGISGSGKSSLAFDTLYAEGQRRYVESLSAYARQFLGIMEKPDVDRIDGLSPAISIDQKSVSRNPRSTVGTITEIYDYLRLLFARVGEPHCPKCKRPVAKQTQGQILEQILSLGKKSEIMILAPVIKGKKGEHTALLNEINRQGFVRVRVDNYLYRIEDALNKTFDRYKVHNIEIVIDRVDIPDPQSKNFSDDKLRISDSIETALKIGKGAMIIARDGGKDLVFSEHFACGHCGINLPEIQPRNFSFNSPYGACPRCTGLGKKLEVDPGLVLPNKNLTLAQGAIRPWMSSVGKMNLEGWYWFGLEELAKRRNFSVNVPIKKLSKENINYVLYGDGQFEGVIPNMERRYKETSSDYIRQEMEKYMFIKICPLCKGRRLKKEFLAVTFCGKSIDQITGMFINDAQEFFLNALKNRTLAKTKKKIAEPIIKEVLSRLQFLIDVGLPYLSQNREAATLSGGEAQRIRLATQLGSGLAGVLYILDEPSIGLHQRDQERLIKTLKGLKDLGNTVLVVEHDEETIKSADWVIDIGPGAGKKGGEVVFEGTPKRLLKSKSITGKYLSRRMRVNDFLEETKRIIKPDTKYIEIIGASEHNLKNINVKIPLNMFTVITGVSGSGKSTLLNDILGSVLSSRFYNARVKPGEHKEIRGMENLNKVINIDQSPIGRTPRSNPVTYTGAFNYIRDMFAKTKEARIRGYLPGRFSFNVKGGRCEACEGQGLKKIEMHFLPDLYVECEECKGRRYNEEALQIEYKGKNIAEVLEMSVDEARSFFKNIPPLYARLKTLSEVGLGYIHLGQPATTLSGGEAQRIKLSTELARRATGKTLYILDEPTIGLHYDDVKKLLLLLHRLVEKGNSVLLIEHNLDVIECADWIIDLGPEGGEGGGRIVAQGAPQDIARSKKSYTGQYLKKHLAKSV